MLDSIEKVILDLLSLLRFGAKQRLTRFCLSAIQLTFCGTICIDTGHTHIHSLIPFTLRCIHSYSLNMHSITLTFTYIHLHSLEYTQHIPTVIYGRIFCCRFKSIKRTVSGSSMMSTSKIRWLLVNHLEELQVGSLLVPLKGLYSKTL